MQTGNYITVDEVLNKAAAFSGNTDFKSVPKGFMIQMIEDAFQQLNIESKMLDGHASFKMSEFSETLNIPLPVDCFNVKNVWMYEGDECNFEASGKVWWKDNMYTKGGNYIANRRGTEYQNDPYYLDNSLLNTTSQHNRLDLIRYSNVSDINNVLFYNVQNGVLMLSPSCRNWSKVHVHYNSSGCDISDAPIIPIFFKQAIEDYVTESSLRFRLANEPSNFNMIASMQRLYDNRTDRRGFNGSWHDAVKKSKIMSSDERNAMAIYMGKAAWATGR